jgi:class 3 adenylate cyclase/tetratricopeptide (TPR) repeat protein
LRMSIGIHSGRFDFLLPGRVHQDLVITGAGVTTTLALEAAADPGEILVSPATAAALPEYSIGAAKGPGHLLRRTGTVPSTGSQILFRTYDEEQVWRHVPSVFRERPDLLGTGSDHRRAAMAFVQVSGLDAEVERDPADVLRRMDELAAVVEEAASETGISVLDTDVSKDGFKYFLAAGAPTTLEDSEGRMLRALLRIVGADIGLEVRAGCAAGRVFAGTVGAPFRCTYAAMGDTTNLAARLCGKAAPGGVVAHAPLLARSLTQFDHTGSEDVLLKGKPDPVPVVTVLGVLGQRGRASTTVPFVGREAELATLAEAFAGLGRGDGAVVEIIGEAGLGKSRLADVALGALDVPVLSVGADPYGAFVPYQTLRGLLRALLALFPDSTAQEVGARLAAFAGEHGLAGREPLLARVLGADLAEEGGPVDELDERFRAAQLHEAVRDLLDALITEPTALLIDDAQWIDESSAEALSFAFADLRGRPWAVAVARRDGDEGLHGSATLPTVVVRPQPLTSEDAQSLIAVDGASLRPDEVEQILGRGGGNPYFLLQLALSDSGQALPESIEELVSTRIDSLDATERELLRDAAVLGNRFPTELYVGATGDGDFADAVRSPTLAPYLQAAPDGTISFQRDIYREVAYGQLSFRKRRQLHFQVARAIEEHPHLAGSARLPMLSLHYHHAGLWERSYHASLAAGDQARAAWANDEAVLFFQRALDSGRRIQAPPVHLRSLHASVGDVCQVAGRYDDARRAFRDALRGAQDPAERVPLLLKLGRVLDFASRFGDAQRLYRQAAALVEELGDAALAAEVHVSDASSHLLQGRAARARDIAATGWTFAEGLPDDDRAARLRARAAYLHDSAAGMVDGPKGLRFGEQPLEMFVAIGDLYYAGIAANNLGSQCFEEGRWGEAAERFQAARSYALRAGDRIGAAIMTMNLAEVLGLQGDVAAAEALLEDAAHTFVVLKAPLFLANALSVTAMVALRSGDLDRAEEMLERARELHLEVGSVHESDDDDVRRLELLLARERYVELAEGARALLARKQALNAIHESRVRRFLAQAQFEVAGTDGVREELERALALAVSMESHHDIALTEGLLAELGGADAAARRRRAEAKFARLGVAAEYAKSPSHL